MTEPSTMLIVLEASGEGRMGTAGRLWVYYIDGCGGGQGSKSDSSGGLYEVVHRSVCNGRHLYVRTTRT